LERQHWSYIGDFCCPHLARSQKHSAQSLQALPLVVLMIAIYASLHLRTLRARRRELISRISADTLVVVDVFRTGLRSSSELLSIELPWKAVRVIYNHKGRIEVESDALVIYVPAASFADPEALNAAEMTIRRAWREALLQGDTAAAT
jgi:hypothetical protein